MQYPLPIRPTVVRLVPFLSGQLLGGFCGAVPLLSNPPAWLSWQACPSAFQRPAGRSPAAMPSGLSPRRCLSVLSDTGLLHHTGSVPGCGAARTVPVSPASPWQAAYGQPCTCCTAPTSPALGEDSDPALGLNDLSPQVIVTGVHIGNFFMELLHGLDTVCLQKAEQGGVSCKARIFPLRVSGRLSCCWASHKSIMLGCWPSGFSASAFDQL